MTMTDYCHGLISIVKGEKAEKDNQHQSELSAEKNIVIIKYSSFKGSIHLSGSKLHPNWKGVKVLARCFIKYLKR